MLYNILPEWLYSEISKNFPIENLYEVRIRANKPITVNFKGNYQTLKQQNGYGKNFIASYELLEYIVAVITKQSIYAYNEQIKHCYVTTDDGLRVGICGVVVYENGKVITIKKVTSINIRISHQVYNCSEKIINFICYNNIVKNTLVISPPGAGKTTMIRDIALKLSNEKGIKNLLIVDERFEIAGLKNSLDVGDFTDILSGGLKHYAFSETLKTMSPKVIITDEISNEDDIAQIKETIKSGVSVIATAHAKNIEDLKYKKYFESLMKDKYFERIVVLSSRQGVGTIEGVFDENLRCLYLPYMLWKLFL